MIVGTPDGRVRARSVKRLPALQRSNSTLINSIRGTPWQPLPTADTDEVRHTINVEEPVIPASELPAPFVPSVPVGRSFYIRRDIELKDFGFTPGCDGCRAAEQDLPPRPHSAECRARIARHLEQTSEGRARLQQAEERKAKAPRISVAPAATATAPAPSAEEQAFQDTDFRMAVEAQERENAKRQREEGDVQMQTGGSSSSSAAAPAAAPQNIEVAASPEALQPIGVAPVPTPASDAAQGNETIVQAAPELVDNNDVKPIIRLDAATPTTATSQITPAAAQNSLSTVVDGLAQLVTSHAQKASQTGTSSRLSITLRPDDLGTVQLEIRAGANGLEIATATTHESGRAAIESVIPEIRTMAQQSGLRISEIQIGTNSSSDNLADLHQHGDQRDNHQRPEPHRRTPEAANMTRTINPTDSHIGRVNVEV